MQLSVQQKQSDKMKAKCQTAWCIVCRDVPRLVT